MESADGTTYMLCERPATMGRGDAGPLLVVAKTAKGDAGDGESEGVKGEVCWDISSDEEGSGWSRGGDGERRYGTAIGEAGRIRLLGLPSFAAIERESRSSARSRTAVAAGCWLLAMDSLSWAECDVEISTNSGALSPTVVS